MMHGQTQIKSTVVQKYPIYVEGERQRHDQTYISWIYPAYFHHAWLGLFATISHETSF
jgi:predicted small integral membrane protein